MDGTQSLFHQATNARAQAVYDFQDVADFNGDGKADVLWRHESGQTHVWLMDGATQSGTTKTNALASNAGTYQAAA